MIGSFALVALLAVIVPTGTVVPSASPSADAGVPLRTIITVKTSPYCNALAQHFNSAFVPMVGNDRMLDSANVSLLEINDAFKYPDFQNRMLKARDRLEKADRELIYAMPAIQDQINRLREASKLTQDPQAAAQVHDAAEQLQAAYMKQRALAFDLQGVVNVLMDENNWDQHELNGTSVEISQMPSDMKDIKSYLRFDGQRDVINRAEGKAVDIAYDAATKHCANP